MKFLSTLFLSSFLFLSGCAFVLKEPQKSQKIDRLYIEENVFLETHFLFPLPFTGMLWQNITARFQETSHLFSVHLTLSPQTFKAVAFNDIAGQLYKLDWHSHNLTWSASQYLPSSLKPEKILADFLLVSLPLNILQKNLHGATVTEERGLRIIRINKQIVWEIKRSDSSGLFWKYIVLKNLKRGYQFTIQTRAHS